MKGKVWLWLRGFSVRSLDPAAFSSVASQCIMVGVLSGAKLLTLDTDDREGRLRFYHPFLKGTKDCQVGTAM